MKLVCQKHARGCGVAALAMVTGHDYDVIAEWFLPTDLAKEGVYKSGMDAYLADHGFAVVRKHEGFGVPGKEKRKEWPCQPFADRHICHVVVGNAQITHFVAMDAVGRVFDPLQGERSLADYSQVWSVAGIYELRRREGKA